MNMNMDTMNFHDYEHDYEMNFKVYEYIYEYEYDVREPYDYD